VDPEEYNPEDYGYDANGNVVLFDSGGGYSGGGYQFPDYSGEMGDYPFFQDQPLGPSKPMSSSSIISLNKYVDAPKQVPTVDWGRLLETEQKRFSDDGRSGINPNDPFAQQIVSNYLNDLAANRTSVEEAKRNFMFRSGLGTVPGGPAPDPNGDFRKLSKEQQLAVARIFDMGQQSLERQRQAQPSELERKKRYLHVLQQMISLRQRAK